MNSRLLQEKIRLERIIDTAFLNSAPPDYLARFSVKLFSLPTAVRLVVGDGIEPSIFRLSGECLNRLATQRISQELHKVLAGILYHTS